MSDTTEAIEQARLKDHLDTIWCALEGYRETCIPEEQDESYDAEWDGICGAMANLTEALGLEAT